MTVAGLETQVVIRPGHRDPIRQCLKMRCLRCDKTFEIPYKLWHKVKNDARRNPFYFYCPHCGEKLKFGDILDLQFVSYTMR